MRPGLNGTLGLLFDGVPSVDPAEVEAAVLEDGISIHSSPDILSFFTKNGQSLINIDMDSFASAVEMGTGDDLTIAAITSVIGKARRFLLGVSDVPAVGLEKSIQMLSATPPRRPSKHRRLISSWLIFNIWSRVIEDAIASGLGALVGDIDKER